ncbi:MAG: peptidase U32 family protein, partial [Syntrophothermus sp.]
FDEISEVTSYCKEHNVKCYLTINIIIYEDEVELVEAVIAEAKKAGVDAIICWDMSVIQLCKKYDMPICISTQASISNSLAAKYYENLGAYKIVLARECTLNQIKEIRSKTDLRIEAFVHGAMCIAVSGRCFMSHHMFGKSANRGECVQPCRREFQVIDDSTDKDLIIGEDYVLSPNDLCTIEFIDQLIEAGIDSFKIEGRKRSPEYVLMVTKTYRKAIDLYFEGKLTNEVKKELLEELKKVYNRGFSSGFYFGAPSSEAYANIYGSKAVERKAFIGKIVNYYKEPKVAYINLETGNIKTDEEVYIIGPTTGTIKIPIENIINNDVQVESAGKGDKITIPCEILVRPGDSVYRINYLEELAK